MRRFTNSLMTISFLCLLSLGVLAQGKDLKEHITLNDDYLVGSTLVKKGDYLVKYNAQTGEVSFMEGKKVVATAKATVKMNEKKAESDALYTKKTSTGEELIGMRLSGQHEELTFTSTSADMK